MYGNGGPVIMVQLENEYGSFGSDEGFCDVAYLQHLRVSLRTVSHSAMDHEEYDTLINF